MRSQRPRPDGAGIDGAFLSAGGASAAAQALTESRSSEVEPSVLVGQA